VTKKEDEFLERDVLSGVLGSDQKMSESTKRGLPETQHS
jgi:hypothetical protein